MHSVITLNLSFLLAFAIWAYRMYLVFTFYVGRVLGFPSSHCLVAAFAPAIQFGLLALTCHVRWPTPMRMTLSRSARMLRA